MYMQIWSSRNLAGSSWISFIISVGESTWCSNDHNNAFGKCPWCWYLLKGDLPIHGSHSLSSIVPGDICWVIAALAVGTQLWAAWSQPAMVFPSDSRWWFCAELVMKSPISMAALHISAIGCRINEITFLSLISPPHPQVLMETFGVLLETGVEKGQIIFLLVIKTGARICD